MAAGLKSLSSQDNEGSGFRVSGFRALGFKVQGLGFKGFSRVSITSVKGLVRDCEPFRIRPGVRGWFGG